MPELLPVFQLFLHCVCLLVLLPLQEGRERIEELWASFLPKVLSLLKPPGASAAKSPIPFLDPWSRRALPPPLQPFLLGFPSLVTMFPHYSTITIAGVRAGTASPYLQGHQRAAVHPQVWKEFQKETNRHLRVERISP